MPRPTFSSLPWLSLSLLGAIAACSAPARAPTTTNRVPVAAYTLLPITLGGGYSHSSSVQSNTTVTGSLELRGAQATLAVTFDSFVGHIRCNQEMQTVQQCAGPDAKDVSTKFEQRLRGELRMDHGALVGTLRDKDRALALTCTESFIGLACTIGTPSIFGSPGDVPSTLAFASPGTKRFEVAPRDVKEIGRVTGTVEMTGATVSVALSVDGGPPAVLPGTVRHGDNPIYEELPDHTVIAHMRPGLVIMAQTSPTRNLSARCRIEDDGVHCEVSADRSVLGKAEHLGTELVLIPKRG